MDKGQQRIYFEVLALLEYNQLPVITETQID